MSMIKKSIMEIKKVIKAERKPRKPAEIGFKILVENHFLKLWRLEKSMKNVVSGNGILHMASFLAVVDGWKGVKCRVIFQLKIQLNF